MVWKGQIFSQDSVPDFLLKADSPAREVGIDITKSWTVQGKTNQPLVGYPSEYFQGERPDAGAEIYGKILDDVQIISIPGYPAVSVFPNPFKDKIMIRFKEKIPGDLIIQLADLHGSMICQEYHPADRSAESEIIFHNRIVISGIYILRIIYPDQTVYSQKLVCL